ncbi:hypothetical protein [Streptosporangium sp. KLBMP 9127]|nr:hypothetical protein [Streptosporangium sp. KLBMP 9127]
MAEPNEDNLSPETEPEIVDAEAPEVVAHSEEGEETPWCGIHQEHDS